ncbi:alpha/beta hydrolase [Nocardia brasiliensis]|uniref:alpha/beta hydrolase n=1 Tax=Nocardia brasiliensis TaxID=37326 RepID=UPI002456E356|nr:alpha/beta hydrolase [Nocardia brasiliensis]
MAEREPPHPYSTTGGRAGKRRWTCARSGRCPPASPPHVPDVTGLPPVLVVAATGDPATPYPGGVALARALHATLITYESVQHGAFGDGVACVDEPVLRYLIDLALPPGDVRCAHAK